MVYAWTVEQCLSGRLKNDAEVNSFQQRLLHWQWRSPSQSHQDSCGMEDPLSYSRSSHSSAVGTLTGWRMIALQIAQGEDSASSTPKTDSKINSIDGYDLGRSFLGSARLSSDDTPWVVPSLPPSPKAGKLSVLRLSDALFSSSHSTHEGVGKGRNHQGQKNVGTRGMQVDISRNHGGGSARYAEDKELLLATPKAKKGDGLLHEYDLLEEVGAGAFGRVYKARSRVGGELVVVKEVVVGARAMLDSPGAHQTKHEVKQEVKVLASLSHPNIVKYFDSFEDTTKLQIVMEWCQGGDLSKYLKRRQGELLEEEEIMRMFVQIAVALDYVHHHGILHRDLKSSNIFLAGGGIVKLGDFGICKVLESYTHMARSMVGTPNYLSPEICQNRPYGVKSDVWALGCVLYEMCALKQAFGGKSMPGVLGAIMKAKPKPLPTCYSPDLHRLVGWLLARDPLQRPMLADVLADGYVRSYMYKYRHHLNSMVEIPGIASLKRALDPWGVVSLHREGSSMSRTTTFSSDSESGAALLLALPSPRFAVLPSSSGRLGPSPLRASQEKGAPVLGGSGGLLEPHSPHHVAVPHTSSRSSSGCGIYNPGPGGQAEVLSMSGLIRHMSLDQVLTASLAGAPAAVHQVVLTADKVSTKIRFFSISGSIEAAASCMQSSPLQWQVSRRTITFSGVAPSECSDPLQDHSTAGGHKAFGELELGEVLQIRRGSPRVPGLGSSLHRQLSLDDAQKAAAPGTGIGSLSGWRRMSDGGTPESHHLDPLSFRPAQGGIHHPDTMAVILELEDSDREDDEITRARSGSPPDSVATLRAEYLDEGWVSDDVLVSYDLPPNSFPSPVKVHSRSSLASSSDAAALHEQLLTSPSQLAHESSSCSLSDWSPSSSLVAASPLSTFVKHDDLTPHPWPQESRVEAKGKLFTCQEFLPGLGTTAGSPGWEKPIAAVWRHRGHHKPAKMNRVLYDSAAELYEAGGGAAEKLASSFTSGSAFSCATTSGCLDRQTSETEVGGCARLPPAASVLAAGSVNTREAEVEEQKEGLRKIRELKGRLNMMGTRYGFCGASASQLGSSLRRISV